MRSNVLSFIGRERLLRPGDRVGVAVSAGADSVALLRFLLEARDALGIVVSVVHFNHQIRGSDADADQEFAAGLARRFDLEFHGGSADTPAYARQHGLSLEAAGRRLRYQFFRQLLRDGVSDRIATAHTRDDQAETVLLRFLRGAGTRGQAGIYPELVISPQPLGTSPQPSAISHQRGGPAVVRPFLEVTREEIRRYLQSIGQEWREDSSNRDLRFARNRVRHKLLPQLQTEFNPGIEKVLAEMAEVAREEEGYWARLVGELQSSVVSRQSSGEIVLSADALANLPLAVQRRLVRAAAEQLGCRMGFSHVKEILDLLTSPPEPPSRAAKGETRQLHFPAGLRAQVDARELRLYSSCPTQTHTGEAKEYEYVLKIPGEVRIEPLGRTIRAVVAEGSVAKWGYNQAQLDPGLLAPALRVRNWRPGDRYWPEHTKSPAKVKELLQVRRLARPEKSLWPVVVSGSDIVWVPGFAVPARYRAPETGGRVVVLEEVTAGK